MGPHQPTPPPAAGAPSSHHVPGQAPVAPVAGDPTYPASTVTTSPTSVHTSATLNGMEGTHMAQQPPVYTAGTPTQQQQPTPPQNSHHFSTPLPRQPPQQQPTTNGSFVMNGGSPAGAMAPPPPPSNPAGPIQHPPMTRLNIPSAGTLYVDSSKFV